MPTAAANEAPEIIDLDRDGWDDAWVAAYPEVDRDQPLADLNGDGMPVVLEMHLGSDPFAEIEGKEKSAAQEYEEWQRRLIARVRRIEEARARTRRTLNSGFRDAEGNPCCPEQARLAKLATLGQKRLEVEAEEAAKAARVDAWLVENRDSLPIEIRDRRPCDIVDGQPKWITGLSKSLAQDSFAFDLWPGSSVVGAGLTHAQSLTGAGQRIYMWDVTGVRESHEQFNNGRVFNEPDQDNDDVADDAALEGEHGTAVASVLAGGGDTSIADPAASDVTTPLELSRGIAYGAEVIVYDTDFEIPEIMRLAGDPDSELFLSNHSYGLECGWEKPPGSSTWLWHGDRGSFPGNPIYEDKNFGKYMVREAILDQIVYSAETYLPVFAAGNDTKNILHSHTPRESLDHGPDPDTEQGQQGFIYYVGGVPESYRRPLDGSHPLRGFNDPDPWQDTIRPEGTAKNVLTVGVLGMAAGPTDDFRIKPDVVMGDINYVGPESEYDFVVEQAARNSSDTAYRDVSGSSFAAATVTGCLAMLREQWETRRVADPRPLWGSTLKALAIATACDIESANSSQGLLQGFSKGPDLRSGFGVFNMSLAAQLMEAATDPGRLRAHPVIIQTYLPYIPDENNDGDGEGKIEFDIVRNYEAAEEVFFLQGCPNAEERIKVAVCWSDPAGDHANFPLPSELDDDTGILVNDLDVTVQAQGGGGTFFPWVINTFNPAIGSQRRPNSIDNVEVVEIDLPNELSGAPTGLGVYRVSISHKLLLRDGENEGAGETPNAQPVSIVLTGAFTVAPPFQIHACEEIGLGGQRCVTFGSVPGEQYGLEVSSDCVSWSSLPAVVVASSDVTSIDFQFTDPLQEFVRVRNLP